MRRPWKVAVGVVLGAALVMPASALAAPTITITSPENSKYYARGAAVAVAYTCADATECTALSDTNTPLANGGPLDTSTNGPHFITVTAKDATSTVQQQATYFVSENGQDPNPPVPPTMNINLGQPAVFAPFIPGIANDYTTTVALNLLSTAGDATLSVADSSATNTGHLVNGTYALAAPIQVGGTRPAAEGQPAPVPAYAPVGGNANPTTVIVYNGPINETDTIHFKQPISQTESLRTGAYSKTLTFTLSTTQP
jgi:hypothetical protein